MKKNINNNVVKLTILDNFGSMLAFIYLMVIEFSSKGLFVPSINPPIDNNFLPDKNFFNIEHTIYYNKKVLFMAHDNEIILKFETIDDANKFCEELDKTWWFGGLVWNKKTMVAKQL